MMPPIAHYVISTVSLRVALDSMGRRGRCRGMPSVVPYISAPAATATALHDNPTACHGNPRGPPMFTAPVRVRGRVRVRWYAVDVCGRKVPWYAVEGLAAGGATAMRRHVSRKNTLTYIDLDEGYVPRSIYQRVEYGPVFEIAYRLEQDPDERRYVAKTNIYFNQAKKSALSSSRQMYMILAGIGGRKPLQFVVKNPSHGPSTA